MPNINALWAKKQGSENTYPLLAHLLDTAAVAQVLFEQWLRPGLQRQIGRHFLNDRASRCVGYIAGTHDLGKATPFFAGQPTKQDEEWEEVRVQLRDAGFDVPSAREAQDILAEAEGEKYFLTRHEQGTSFYYAKNGAKSMRANKPATQEWLALIGMGHHGQYSFAARHTWKNIIRPQNREREGWYEAQVAINDALLEGMGIEKADLPHTIPAVEIILLTGLVILADRLASHEEFVTQGQAILAHDPDALNDPREWAKQACVRALPLIKDTVGLYNDWESPSVAYEKILGGHNATAVQKDTMQAGDGLASLMIPTGHGKTEAGLLRHSTRPERLIFLLPTVATSNSMMDRINKAYEGTSNLASLAHSSALIEDFYMKSNPDETDGLLPSDFARNTANLLAPITVGTVDQALKAALPRRYAPLRLLSLANAHVVIDEVHTMDPYQMKLLLSLLGWLKITESRVTLLSATLSKTQREDILASYGAEDIRKPAFPAIDRVAGGAVHTRKYRAGKYTVDFHLEETIFDNAGDSHTAWVDSLLSQHPQARLAVICNTVKRAQYVASHVKKTYDDVEVVLLHSRMTAQHRKNESSKLDEKIGKHGSARRIVVVGTQVIEASLDIDVDFLRTELCPAPSLIQRMGRAHRRDDPDRVHRVGETSTKPISVVKFHDTPFQALPYFSAELARVWAWLKENTACEFPRKSQNFIDACDFSLKEVFKLKESGEYLGSDIYRELSESLTRSQRGADAARDLTVFEDMNCTMGEFARLTHSDAPTWTRLIDLPTESVVIFDEGGKSNIPGAWYGDSTRFLTPNRWELGQMMLGSMSIPEYAAKNLRTVHEKSEYRSLAGYRMVAMTADQYDPFLGFVG